MKAPCWWRHSWLPRPPGTGTRAGLLDALRRSASADRAALAAYGAAASVPISRPFPKQVEVDEERLVSAWVEEVITG